MSGSAGPDLGRPRVHDSMVRNMTTSAWARILSWLRDYAPSTLANLRPPGDESLLRDLLHSLPVTVPGDLIDLWVNANGENVGENDAAGFIIPPLYHLMSADESLEYHSMRLSANIDPVRVEDLRNSPAGEYSYFSLWLPEWIPFAGTSEGMFVDCRRGPLNGCVSEHFHTDGQQGPVWNSIADMTNDIADRLEAVDVAAIDEAPDPLVDGWYIPWR